MASMSFDERQAGLQLATHTLAAIASWRGSEAMPGTSQRVTLLHLAGKMGERSQLRQQIRLQIRPQRQLAACSRQHNDQ